MGDCRSYGPEEFQIGTGIDRMMEGPPPKSQDLSPKSSIYMAKHIIFSFVRVKWL
jgi:hypothetical protein